MRLLSSPQRAIRAVLLSQVLMAGLIVGLDLWRAPGSAAPGLYAPPAQGPNVRPYRPDLRPADPARPGAPAMRQMPERLQFDVEDDRIRIIGQIAPGDADRFVEWLDRARPVAVQVALDSSGGSVSDAVAIGRTIRGAALTTRVEDGAVCLSACPYILAGGTERRVETGGVVGVHQHYFGQNTFLPAFMAVSDLQRAQAGVMEYLVQMGVDLRLMTHALRTPPAEINVLEPDLMAELRLTTTAEG
ncbi:hypothetical protein D3P06_18845 [Paracoccus aestuarii]|uniref:Clp protease ClpP n=1 Tax=Paracoccus aestuarii TaxID=453842 RepID=A0A418ZPA6_9RHOB|nr:hypothetical protein [Paracoccus aestuarii]RJK93598.1 hypothetical protein D3P06_18845 [Paracoccus aestuarii]WCQ98047.1 hypothetical protein JHW48_08660 [Paracoccus aestuarii]